jgi:hypothetical protein
VFLVNIGKEAYFLHLNHRIWDSYPFSINRKLASNIPLVPAKEQTQKHY